jgi:hypothetical protein
MREQGPSLGGLSLLVVAVAQSAGDVTALDAEPAGIAAEEAADRRAWFRRAPLRRLRARFGCGGA